MLVASPHAAVSSQPSSMLHTRPHSSEPCCFLPYATCCCLACRQDELLYAVWRTRARSAGAATLMQPWRDAVSIHQAGVVGDGPPLAVRLLVLWEKSVQALT